MTAIVLALRQGRVPSDRPAGRHDGMSIASLTPYLDDLPRRSSLARDRVVLPPVSAADRPDERLARGPADEPQHHRLLRRCGREPLGQQPGSADCAGPVLRRPVVCPDPDRLQGADRDVREQCLSQSGQGYQEPPTGSRRAPADLVPDPLARVLSPSVRLPQPPAARPPSPQLLADRSDHARAVPCWPAIRCRPAPGDCARGSGDRSPHNCPRRSPSSTLRQRHPSDTGTGNRGRDRASGTRH